ASAPWAAGIGSKALFVGMLCIIVSMYGGGFATVPAYLADIFGTQFVGAIHGRLLTAWATAGIIGPVVVNYIREAQIAAGIPRAQVYDFTMYILAGMPALGLIANLMVKPLADKWYMSDEEVASLQAKTKSTDTGPSGSFGIGKGGFDAKALIAWAIVGIPIAWGIWITLQKTFVLFT
ncbi:MFS transporter, partial [Klebsiella pneumoniae]